MSKAFLPCGISSGLIGGASVVGILKSGEGGYSCFLAMGLAGIGRRPQLLRAKLHNSLNVRWFIEFLLLH
jgi:hypothetical protein